MTQRRVSKHQQKRGKVEVDALYCVSEATKDASDGDMIFSRMNKCSQKLLPVQRLNDKSL